jgi:hypothetical protein
MTAISRCCKALLGVSLLSFVCGAHAADVLWFTNDSLEFHDPAAWLGSAPPLTHDRAVFGAPFSGYTVGFSEAVTTAGLLFSTSAVTFDLSGADYFAEGVTDISDGAEFTVRDGLMLMSDSIFVGGGSSLSSLTLGFRATISGPAVFIGRNGPGLVTVGPGGRLETALVQAGYWTSNEGRLLVDHGVVETNRAYFGGSETCDPFCNVGVGPGRLEVVNGGSFSTQVLSLGKNGNAQVDVNTAGTLTATDITIAAFGSGSITVQSGGSLQANSIAIEAVQGTPAPGPGSVNVLAGGRVEVNSMQVGPAGYSSTGTASAERKLTVSGADAQVLVSGGLAVKGGGSRMDISQGGYVRSDNALIAGSRNVAAEVTVLSGGRWENLGAMEVGKFLESGSRLTIDGGRVDTGSMYFVASTSCSPFCNVVPRSDLVLRNGGILNTGDFFGGRIGEAGIRIESGSAIHSTGRLLLGSGFRPVEVFIAGAGSEWVVQGDTTLGLSGGLPAATALLQIDDGGLFRTGGVFSSSEHATVRLIQGTLDVGSFGPLGSPIDFQSGHVITHANLAIQPGAPLGTNLLLESNRSLSVLATTTIAAGQSLTVDGGRFATHSLQPIGNFSFVAGVLALTSDPFEVGPGGLLGSAVALTDTRRLEVTNQLSVAPTGILNVSGDALHAGTLHNTGTVQLGGGVSRITTTQLTNAGRVLGSGAIQGQVHNDKEGQIRVTSGQELHIGAGLTNSGQVFVLGGTLQVGDTLENAQGGFVSGRGVLATGGVTNVSTMAFSGTTDLIGDVRNEKEGAIVISGGSTLTFYDDLTHNGAEIRATPGNSAVFFGSVKGEGRFTGGGDFFFEGDLRPGNSPGITSVTGNATLGPSALEIEIAGLVPGSEHDAVHVSGSLTLLGGTLDVLLLDGFAPGAGDAFDILDFASLSGTFSALNLPGLTPSLFWDSSQLYSAGVLSVQAVPEPGTYALMAAGLLLLLGRGRLRGRWL